MGQAAGPCVLQCADPLGGPPLAARTQALQAKHGSAEDLPELAKQQLAAMMMQR
jgi:hypothetical protein